MLFNTRINAVARLTIYENFSCIHFPANYNKTLLYIGIYIAQIDIQGILNGNQTRISSVLTFFLNRLLISFQIHLV